MRIHILDSPRYGRYEAVVHFTPPGGSNAVGTPWKAILLEHYPNPEPVAFSDEAEKAEIIAGNIVEIPMGVDLEPGESSGPVLQAALEKLAAHRITQWLHEPQRRFAYYGYSQGEVT